MIRTAGALHRLRGELRVGPHPVPSVPPRGVPLLDGARRPRRDGTDKRVLVLLLEMGRVVLEARDEDAEKAGFVVGMAYQE